MPGAFQSGQTQATAYLQSPDAKIAGLGEETAHGRLGVMVMLIFAFSLTTTIIRDRVPTSKEQLYAMVPIDWCVMLCTFALWLYSLGDILVRTAMADFASSSMPELCRSSSSLCIMAVVVMLFPFFVALLETSRLVLFPQTPRHKSKEYMAHTTILIICGGFVVLASYRISGVGLNGLCVIGLPHDTLSPILGVVVVACIVYCTRICVPLLRIDHARMKAWGLRTACGILIACILATLSLTLLVSTHGYIYHNYCTLLCLGFMSGIVGSLAYLITWRPQYKRVVPLPEATVPVPDDEEAQQTRGQHVLCSNCQRQGTVDRQTVSKFSSGARTAVSHYGKVRTFSILDSKSVAEFLFDETIQATPELPEARRAPSLAPSRISETVPLRMVPWSALRAPAPVLSARQRESLTSAVGSLPAHRQSTLAPGDLHVVSGTRRSNLDGIESLGISCSSKETASVKQARRDVPLDGAIQWAGYGGWPVLTSYEDEITVASAKSITGLKSLTAPLPPSPTTRARFLAAPAVRGSSRQRAYSLSDISHS